LADERSQSDIDAYNSGLAVVLGRRHRNVEDNKPFAVLGVTIANVDCVSMS
jgi:hypothetical protein